MTATRRLAAIIAANVAEYGRLIAADEADTPKPKVGLTIRAVTCTKPGLPPSYAFESWVIVRSKFIWSGDRFS
jgi:hypothetical protein